MATSSRPTARTTDTDLDNGSSRVEVVTARDDSSTQEALIGTDDSNRTANVSWGSIFAGVATFLALVVTLSMASAAMGLNGASGTATGIFSLIAVAISLAVAAYVAGALAVRGGLLHGFLTWAGSILALVLLAGWLGASALGAAGNLVGSIADRVSVTQQQVDDATQTAQQNQPTEEEIRKAADQAATGAWWAFAGSLIGAGVAAGAGVAGARSVIRRETEVTTSTAATR